MPCPAGFAAALTLLASLVALPAQATELASPADSWVFNGRVFDGGKSAATIAMVVVQGDRIVCVAEPGGCAVPAGAQRIEIGERTLLPGLIDLHTHARPTYAPLWVEAGVTTIRDGNNSLEMLDAIRAAEPLAPRVFGSGPLLDGPESVIAAMGGLNGAPGSHPIREQQLMLVTTPAEAGHAVDLLAANGAQHIKLYEQLAPEVYFAAASRARHHGLPVMTDLGMATTRGLSKAQVDVLQAVEAGATSIEHGGGVALAYQRLGGNPLDEALDEALLDQIARPIVEAGAALVPTLVGTLNMAAETYPSDSSYPLAEKMQPEVHTWWRSLHEGHGSKHRHEYRQEEHFRRAFLRRFLANGGIVGAGTDTPALPMVVAGDALHVELRALEALGLSPAEALHAATGAAAGILGSEDVGRIAPGRLADLLLVDGDPSRQLADSRNVRAVWQSGRLVFGEP